MGDGEGQRCQSGESEAGALMNGGAAVKPSKEPS